MGGNGADVTEEVNIGKSLFLGHIEHTQQTIFEQLLAEAGYSLDPASPGLQRCRWLSGNVAFGVVERFSPSF